MLDAKTKSWSQRVDWSSACDNRTLRGVDMNTAHPTERSRASEARPKVAVVQAASVAFDLERTLRKAEALAADAASQGTTPEGVR